MNPGNPNPFMPLDNPGALPPTNPQDINPQMPQNPANPEPLMPQISPVPENIPQTQPNYAINQQPNYGQPQTPDVFQNTNPNVNLPQPGQPENNPSAYGAYAPETIQNQNINPSLQQPPNQLPQIVDPNSMFNSSTGYQPSSDLMGMPPEMPHASANTSSSGNKIKLILIACGVFMVIILIIVAIIVLGSKSSKKTPVTKNDTPTTKTTPESKAIVATSLYDLDKGCEGSPISNAASYEGTNPHKISLYEESIITKGSYSSSIINITDPTWTVTDKDFANVQLLGCMSMKSSTDSGKKCTLEDSDKKQISIGLYDVVYQMKIIEAKSGKEVATKTINGPAGECPFIASYNKSDPKLYGKPDKGTVNEAIKEFVIL